MRFLLVALLCLSGCGIFNADDTRFDGGVPSIHIVDTDVLSLRGSQTVPVVRVCSTLSVGSITVATSSGTIVSPATQTLAQAMEADCDAGERSQATFVWVGTDDEVVWTVSGDSATTLTVQMPGIVHGVTADMDAGLDASLWYPQQDGGIARLVPIRLTASNEHAGFPNGSPLPDASVVIQADPGLLVSSPPNTDINGSTAFVVTVFDGRANINFTALVDGRLRSQPLSITRPTMDASVD